MIPNFDPTDRLNYFGQLLEIVSLLKAESENKKLGAEQQTENVRYLHELNSVSTSSIYYSLVNVL